MHVSRSVVGGALFALAVSLNACGPEGGRGGHAGHMFGMRHGIGLGMRAMRMGERGTRHGGFRRACEADVTRLCPNAKSRREERECLEGKQTSVSSECKEALAHRRDRGR